MICPVSSLIMASSLSSVVYVGLEHFSLSCSTCAAAVKLTYWVSGRKSILWWVLLVSRSPPSSQLWVLKLTRILVRAVAKKIVSRLRCPLSWPPIFCNALVVRNFFQLFSQTLWYDSDTEWLFVRNWKVVHCPLPRYCSPKSSWQSPLSQLAVSENPDVCY